MLRGPTCKMTCVQKDHSTFYAASQSSRWGSVSDLKAGCTGKRIGMTELYTRICPTCIAINATSSSSGASPKMAMICVCFTGPLHCSQPCCEERVLRCRPSLHINLALDTRRLPDAAAQMGLPAIATAHCKDLRGSWTGELSIYQHTLLVLYWYVATHWCEHSLQ